MEIFVVAAAPPQRGRSASSRRRRRDPVALAGGLLVATTWDTTDLLKITRDIMTEVLGEAPPTPPLNPMALAEEGLFYGLVAGAGFKDVVQTTSTYPFVLGDTPQSQALVGTILTREKVTELDAWDAAEKAFFANIGKYAVTDADGMMSMPANTFRMTVATK